MATSAPRVSRSKRSTTHPPRSHPRTTSRLHAEFAKLDANRLRRRPGAKWQAVSRDLLPAWVADMDFTVAAPIRAALGDLIGSGDFGYPDWPDGVSPVREAFAARMTDRYDWSPDPAHVLEFTNIVQATRVVMQLATQPGDGVAIHTPAFGPLIKAINDMGRRVVPIPFVDNGSGWTFDTERLADRLAGCRLLVLVNPHNPTGRVFTRAELTALANAAERHNILVVSDELHADLAYAPHRHIPFASLGEDVEARTVTLYGASKAFNLAGLRCAVAHLGPRWLRPAVAEQAGIIGSVNLFAVRATMAAWTECDEWLAGTLAYLAHNRDLVAEVVGRDLPAVRHHRPEATYLAWLDCRAQGWGDNPAAVIRERARLELSPGASFNPGGDGFVRLNFATSTPLLTEMLERLVRCAPLVPSLA